MIGTIVLVTVIIWLALYAFRKTLYIKSQDTKSIYLHNDIVYFLENKKVKEGVVLSEITADQFRELTPSLIDEYVYNRRVYIIYCEGKLYIIGNSNLRSDKKSLLN